MLAGRQLQSIEGIVTSRLGDDVDDLLVVATESSNSSSLILSCPGWVQACLDDATMRFRGLALAPVPSSSEGLRSSASRTV